MARVMSNTAEVEVLRNMKTKPSKIGKVMHEFKAGELHSGSKHGPKVTNKKQAVAIAMSEARKAAK